MASTLDSSSAAQPAVRVNLAEGSAAQTALERASGEYRFYSYNVGWRCAQLPASGLLGAGYSLGRLRWILLVGTLVAVDAGGQLTPQLPRPLHERTGSSSSTAFPTSAAVGTGTRAVGPTSTVVDDARRGSNPALWSSFDATLGFLGEGPKRVQCGVCEFFCHSGYTVRCSITTCGLRVCPSCYTAGTRPGRDGLPVGMRICFRCLPPPPPGPPPGYVPDEEPNTEGTANTDGSEANDNSIASAALGAISTLMFLRRNVG